MTLVLRQRFIVFEYLRFEESFVGFAGLLERLWTFGVELEGGLVELQSFFDLYFFGVVDFVFFLIVWLDVESMPDRLLFT